MSGIAAQRKLTIAKAMAEALSLEMERDDSVLVMGEDVGQLGGVFGTTIGLLDQFGSARVRDTPISETGFIGAAVGMAATGLRPVVELMFVDFVGVCLDAIYNLAAKQAYFSGGRVSCPMVLMTSVGGGYGDAGQHSQCLYATFAHLPGLKVVMPSTAYDAKGLMLAAMRDENPVIFMFHKALQGMGWLGTVPGSITHVPAEDYEIPIGKAAVVAEGSDVTVVGLGVTVHHAMGAAKLVRAENVDAEVIDLRTIAPLDRETILASVRKTGRLVVVDDDYRHCGLAGEIIASVCEAGIALKAPPVRVAHPDIPIPFAPSLEHAVLPDKDKVAAAIRSCMMERL